MSYTTLAGNIKLRLVLHARAKRKLKLHGAIIFTHLTGAAELLIASACEIAAIATWSATALTYLAGTPTRRNSAPQETTR